MAQGDLTLYQAFLDVSNEDDSNGQQVDLEADVFKIMLSTSTYTPAATDALPVYGGGTTNIQTNEVSAGGNYSAGGATISGPQLTRSTSTQTWDDDGSDISWAQNGSNPTNARWAIIYDDSTTLKHAVCFIDLGSDFNMTTGPLNINFAAGGILQYIIQASV